MAYFDFHDAVKRDLHSTALSLVIPQYLSQKEISQDDK